VSKLAKSGVEQMTDKKSFLSTDKNLGKNGETMTTNKFPKCEEYGLECLDFGNVSGTHYISWSNKVEQALTQAESKGKLAGKKEDFDKLREIEKSPMNKTVHNGFGVYKRWLKSQLKSFSSTEENLGKEKGEKR
jgi:hypothetical protein